MRRKYDKPPSCPVRKATARDAGQISSLLEELGYPPHTHDFTESRLRKFSRRKCDRILVAEKDNKVIGMAHMHIQELFHLPCCMGRIMALVVSARYRRAGVGKSLVKALEEMARGSGCSRIELTSALHRGEAHLFYETVGFIEKPKRYIKKLERNLWNSGESPHHLI